MSFYTDIQFANKQLRKGYKSFQQNSHSQRVQMNNTKEMQSISRKREKYAETIRKQKRHQMIQKMRRIYFGQNQNQIQTEHQHQSQYQKQLHIQAQTIEQRKTITVQELVIGFDLQFNPKFSTQSINQNPFYLVDMLLAKQANLINITFKSNPNYRTNLIDEKRLPLLKSQYQMQQTYLPQQYPFDLQTMLYRALSVDMLAYQKKYQTMQRVRQQELITFWLEYLSRNKYIETMLKRTYHQEIINFLKLFMAEIWSQDLSEKILLWVNGTQSLQLIFNCLTGHFISPLKYSNIYDIIILGLKSHDLLIKRDSIDVLLNCIRSSDYDQIEQLLQHKPQVFVELCQFINNQQLQKTMYNQSQVMNSLIKAGYCMNLFLWTYDQNILACLKEGAGYVAARLICTNITALIKEGLQMFQLIANIQQREYAREAQLFLIMNMSIRDSCVWQKLATTYEIICHPDESIRQKFISFLNSFICNAELNQICLLLNQFQIPLIDCLVELFVESQNTNVLQGILMIFQSLFYYNRGETQEDEIEEEEYGIYQRGRLQLGEMYQSRCIAGKMSEKGMVKKMMGFVELQSRKIDDTLREQIQTLLEYLYRINSKEGL